MYRKYFHRPKIYAEYQLLHKLNIETEKRHCAKPIAKGNNKQRKLVDGNHHKILQMANGGDFSQIMAEKQQKRPSKGILKTSSSFDKQDKNEK